LTFKAKRFEDINFKKITKECVLKALFKIGSKPIETGKYEIILSKKATSQMLDTMMGVFSAEAVDKNQSPLKGKLNKKIMSTDLTLVEDPNNKKYSYYRYFDDEGIETKYKEIIKDGVLKTYLYNLKNAVKQGIESTGNGFEQIEYRNVYFKPGKSSLEEMVNSTKCGIIIAELEGLNTGFNTINGDFSLQITGNYVENGKIIKPITLMVVSGNFFDMLNNVVMIGNELDFNAWSNYIGGIDLKIRGLTISGE
jgi:PmbA protein